MLIEEFRFFRVPSTTEMPYQVTVLELWHDKRLVKPCIRRVTENTPESFDDLYLIVYPSTDVRNGCRTLNLSRY